MHHQAVSSNHHGCAGGFQGKYDISEVEGFANFDEFQGGFYHAFGRVAVGKQHPFGEGTVINADSQSFVLVAQGNHQRFQGFADFFANFGEFAVGVFASVGFRLLEHVKSGIDSHFVYVFGHFEGNFHAVVVDIGDEGHGLVGGVQFLLDFG